MRVTETLKPFLAIAIGALASGCASWNLEALSQAPAKGSGFTQTLAREYIDFAKFERDQMQDFVDAEHFAVKGYRASRGDVMPPGGSGRLETSAGQARRAGRRPSAAGRRA